MERTQKEEEHGDYCTIAINLKITTDNNSHQSKIPWEAEQLMEEFAENLVVLHKESIRQGSWASPASFLLEADTGRNLN